MRKRKNKSPKTNRIILTKFSALLQDGLQMQQELEEARRDRIALQKQQQTKNYSLLMDSIIHKEPQAIMMDGDSDSDDVDPNKEFNVKTDVFKK